MLRYVRLLPAVVVIGIGLLAIKGVDLARAAQTQAVVSDAPDNSGLAPVDAGGMRATNDFAADGGTSASAAEVDVLTNLTRRRAELDARERALNMRENLLNAGEGRVDQKIAALKSLQSQIQALLTQRDAAQDKQIASLVKTYSAMKPKDAARIFNSLADDVLLPVAKGMKSDVLAPVMAAMNPDAAQKLTVKLAALLKLPEMPMSTDCHPMAAMTPAAETAPAAPVATTTATTESPPQQTAALTPPGTTPAQPPAVITPIPAASAIKPVAAVQPPAKPRKSLPRKAAAPAKPSPQAASTATPVAVAPSTAAPSAKPAAPAVAPSTPVTTLQAPATKPIASDRPAPRAASVPASGPPTPITQNKGG
jgi:flagellar motility protein MotE (MotC chaperone)